MSRFKIGDCDYQIPGSGYESLEWEICKLRAEIARLKHLISSATQELEWWEECEGFLADNGLMDDLRKASQ